MQPRVSAAALAEQILLLTLATEQALTHDDWNEAQALLDRRADILERLEGLPLTPEADVCLDQVQRMEAALLGRLNAQRSTLVGQIIEEKRLNKAAQAYKRAA